MQLAIESKQRFLKDIEKRLGDILTRNNMDTVMGLIAKELDRYEMTIIEQPEDFGMDMLKAFMDAKLIEGRSAKTIERYRYIITTMLSDVNTPIRQISVFHLRSYLMRERERGLSDSSLEGKREVFSAFFNWLQKEGLIQSNPCANLGPIKCQKKVRTPYTDIDIEQLKEACKSIRDKALVCFLLNTGCRISEVVNLNREDIDFQKMSCKVLGKGNKERIAYFDAITAMYLKSYFNARTDDKPALFIGRGSDRMTPGGIRRMLNELAKQCGIDHVHPHRFRRTLATNLINRGMSIQEVARILGHDKIDTTMKYIFTDDKDVQTAYRKYS